MTTNTERRILTTVSTNLPTVAILAARDAPRSWHYALFVDGVFEPGGLHINTVWSRLHALGFRAANGFYISTIVKRARKNTGDWVPVADLAFDVHGMGAT